MHRILPGARILPANATGRTGGAGRAAGHRPAAGGPAAGTVNWLPLTLQSGWATDWTDCPSDHPNPYAPSYAVLNGVVYLTGLAWQYPTPSGSVVGVLPPGARPTHDLYLTVETGGTSNGYLRMYVWFKDNSDGFSLTGLSFQLNS